MGLTSFLKKSLRSKNFIILLLIVFVVYVILNYFLFKWADHSNDTRALTNNIQHPNEQKFDKLNYEKEFFEKNQKAIPKQIVSEICVFIKKFRFIFILIKFVHKQWPHHIIKSNSIKLRTHLNTTKPTFLLEQRLPSAIIIGAAKCATTALLEFISAHPNVVGNSSKEIYYFSSDRIYKKGHEWYRQQMPYSNDKQITIEKTPTYLADLKTPERVYKLNPHMKIIVIVCDPIIRCISHYTHEKASGSSAMIKTLTRKHSSDSDIFQILLYTKTIKNIPMFRDGFYYDHMQNWLRFFPLNQILFVNGEKLKQEPSNEIDKLQLFLNLELLIRKEHFVFNETRGLFCIKSPLTYTTKCMGADKGRKHPLINQTILNQLREFYKMHNEQFFNLIKENSSSWWQI